MESVVCSGAVPLLRAMLDFCVPYPSSSDSLDPSLTRCRVRYTCSTILAGAAPKRAKDAKLNSLGCCPLCPRSPNEA